MFYVSDNRRRRRILVKTLYTYIYISAVKYATRCSNTPLETTLGLQQTNSKPTLSQDSCKQL